MVKILHVLVLELSIYATCEFKGYVHTGFLSDLFYPVFKKCDEHAVAVVVSWLQVGDRHIDREDVSEW